ncbi:class I SAM-dependent methyltransferase [Aquimarina sediminis]|uniref:class I SAM-dependent methyltransferase n=1 Tax=Aquimarina sediminis TaxID=2070536 RepID=UPI000CA05ADF|nr:class I SAM-dependent methyltransferase [Aquimarina sediminis]
MTEEQLKNIAQQLRKPEGEWGVTIGEKMNIGNKFINLYTIDALDIKTNDHILEIGMGNGFFVKDIFDVNHNIKYKGCDYSDEMVTRSKKLNERWVKNGKADFLLSNADKLPFKDSEFDTVFTINTIYFWDNPERILNEIRRVLKPDGKIVISLRPKSSMEAYPFVKYGFDMFNRSDVSKLLLEHGFTTVKHIEKEEPEQEVNGVFMKVETLIVSAQKKNQNL